MLDTIVAILLGWVAGAAVNYLSDVLPVTRRLSVPFCPVCKATFPWRDYLLWPRRCPKCQTPRAWRTWLVEVVFMIAAVGIWFSPPKYLGFALGLILLIFFGVVVVIDMEYRLILHQVSITGAVLGLSLGTWMRAQQYGVLHPANADLWQVAPWWYGLWTSLLGGVIGFGCMWILYMFGGMVVQALARRRGETTDEVALGFGDVNLGGVLGLLLGWQLIGVGLFMAIFIGGAVSLLYILLKLVTRQYHMFMALPYGPFLIAGAALLLYFRDVVTMAVK